MGLVGVGMGAVRAFMCLATLASENPGANTAMDALQMTTLFDGGHTRESLQMLGHVGANHGCTFR
jgi:hypothetical protein